MPFTVDGGDVLSTKLHFSVLIIFERQCVMVERAISFFDSVRSGFAFWLHGLVKFSVLSGTIEMVEMYNKIYLLRLL